MSDKISFVMSFEISYIYIHIIIYINIFKTPKRQGNFKMYPLQIEHTL